MKSGMLATPVRCMSFHQLVAHDALGRVRRGMQHGDFGECLEVCQQILDLDAAHAEARFRRAQAYVGQYQPVVAVSELLAAFDLAPGHPVIQRCLVQLLQLLRRGQFVGVQRQVLVQVFSSVLDAELDEDDASLENSSRVGRISDQAHSTGTTTGR